MGQNSSTAPLGLILAATALLGSIRVMAGGEVASQRFVDVYAGEFEIEIIGFDGERQEPVCKEFSLSNPEVVFFFNHAELIDGYKLEKEYPWHGCAITGTIKLRGTTFTWTITPGGRGTLKSIDPEEEDYVYLVCDEGCEEVFPHGGNIFEEYLQ